MTEAYHEKRPLTTVYKIRDAEGRPVAEHVRQDKADGKGYWWRRDGKKGLGGLQAADLPLYGAHLAHEWDPDALGIVAEGEKARDALDEAGFDAVGTVCGASSTPGREALEVLRGRRVCLWPDADEQGRGHMERIAAALQGVAAEVLVYSWDDAPEKGDAADHPAVARRTAKALDRLLTELEGAPRWKPAAASRTMTAAELLDLDLPPARWAVPDLLPAGVTLLAGKPKLGKSWLALGLCVAVAAGGFALGKKPVEKGEALYLGLEDNTRRMKKRLLKLLRGERAPEGLHVATEWPRLNDGGVEELRAWLTAHPDTRLVVVDTFAKVRPEQKGQVVYQEDYRAPEKLVPLAAEYGVAVLLVHHLRKMSAADPMDEISGSTGLSGGVDGFLVLKRDRGRHDATLHVDGRDIETPTELALTWDGELASWTLAGDAAEYRLTKERAATLQVLRDEGKPMSPKEIAAALGERTNTTTQRLHQMRQAGQVLSPEHGLYTAPKGPNNPNGPKNPKNPKNAPFLGPVVGAPKDGAAGETLMDSGDSANDAPEVRALSDIRGQGPLTVEEAGAELRRAGYGPRKNLPLYLAGETTLKILTCSVLVARGEDPAGWERSAAVVEEAARDPQNHPLDCECEGCL
jgi:hypothetical protein